MKKIALLLFTLTLALALVACDEAEAPVLTPTLTPEAPAILPEILPEEIEAPTSTLTPETPSVLPEILPEEVGDPSEELGDENADEELIDELASGHTGGVALSLTIERLDDQNGPGPLGGLTFMHMFNYEGLSSVEDIIGDTLMIQTFTTVHDFSVITMEIDWDEENESVAFIPAGHYGTVETFEPSEAFIINSYLSDGTLPRSGITFTDANGQQWFFAIIQNQSDDGDPYLLFEMEYNDGALRILPPVG